jgi:cytochrome c556
MLHKLEQEGLKADLAGVNTIISRMSEEKDPIGYSQFLARRKEIEQALQALGDVPEAAGKVALLFGGRPVWGSQGIEADFAAKAIDSFQRAVAAQAAGAAGPVGARGKLAQDVATPLLVTNVGRGSFGFILEEAKKNEQMIESSMHHALDQIASLARGAGAQDEESFIAAVATIQRRALQAIAEFFKQLEESGAQLRLVEGAEDITLDAEAIARARSRTEQTQIEEENFEEEGILVGLVPAQKRFEWRSPDGKIIVGTVEGDIAKAYETSLFEEHPLLGKMRARFAVRTVSRRGGSPHLTYTLLSVGSKSDK